jgi:glutamate synthase (NADPH/NADH)
MAARDVDSYLTGYEGTQLPISGGIVKRVPYETARKSNGEEQAKVDAVAA